MSEFTPPPGITPEDWAVTPASVRALIQDSSTTSRKLRKNHQYGKWKLERLLGQGGNGFVWLAQDSDSQQKVAVKFLANIDGKSKKKMYARFKAEVKVIQENNDIEGLLPIIDSYLPEEIADDFPWYVMPVAQLLDAHLQKAGIESIIQLILEVAKTLVRLHERGICHRDIKPANILVWEGHVCLSDFGLVDYPEKVDLTKSGERIGNKWTIAPEMERNSKASAGFPADVYSLAKTMWMLITGRNDGFEGQYNPESVNGLSRLNLEQESGSDFEFLRPPLVYTTPLDDLLRTSTDDNPLGRPTMKQFVEKLNSWIVVYKDLQKHNPLQWRDVQVRLFPVVLPQRAIWENLDSIVGILDHLGSVSYLNHMFVPVGGGMDMRGARRGLEPDTVELIISDRMIYLIKPKRLVFDSFSFDWEWNYFRLETYDLETTGIGEALQSQGYEHLLEIAPLQYITWADWDRDRDDERLYPEDSRHVHRYFNGDFLIVQKTSTYNRISSTYDGRHNQMGTDEFRDYISDKVQLVKKMQNDEQLATIASEKGVTVDEVIFRYLDKIFTQESHERFTQGRMKDLRRVA